MKISYVRFWELSFYNADHMFTFHAQIVLRCDWLVFIWK